MSRLNLAAAACAVASLFLVSSSQASSVKVAISSPTVATFTASAGETNVLGVTEASHNTIFTDSGALLTAGAGCVLSGPSSASCPAPASNVDANLRDGDDHASIAISDVANVWAGSGDDTVLADSFTAHTNVFGEGGDDEITAGGEGGQLADGGGGNDIVHAGGFAGQATGSGGAGDDILYYATAIGGVATLDGGNGDDTIVAQPSGHPGNTATGGAGDDIIIVQGAAPPNEPNGPYTISGGAGDDSIVGGPYSDEIDAGSGHDFIDVIGGGSDTVTCGPGLDVVRYDGSDTIAADCEVLVPGP